MKKSVRYNDKIANEIVRAISTSTKGIKRLCRENAHWPSSTAIYNWCFENEEFLVRYARAKAFQAEWLVEEALEIAYDASEDTYKDEKGNERLDNEWVQRSKLKVETIKWVASKLAPKLYGTSNIKQNEKDQESLIEKVIDKL
jgi:hypothetical protein